MILMLNEAPINKYAAQNLNGYISSKTAKALMRDTLNLNAVSYKNLRAQ